MAEHKEHAPGRTRVTIFESERNWGQRVDEIKYFDTHDEAVQFCKQFNSVNTLPEVPDWYMVASIE